MYKARRALPAALLLYSLYFLFVNLFGLGFGIHLVVLNGYSMLNAQGTILHGDQSFVGTAIALEPFS